MWVTLHFFIIPFFFSSFFFPRDEAGPRGPCTLHTECDNLLFPDTLCQSLSSGTVYAIHDSSPPSLHSLSLSSLLLLLLFSSRQFIPFMNTFITLHRDHLTRDRNSGRVCGHVLSRWINVDRDRASFHLDSIGRNALFALFVT